MPHQLTAGRERSLRALEEAPEGPQTIGIFTQRSAEVEEPAIDDIYPVGTIAKIHRMWRLPDGSVRLIVQGLERGVLQQVTQTEPYLQAKVLPLADVGDESSTEAQALMRTVNAQFQAVIDLSPNLPEELKVVAVNIDHPGRLADLVAFYLDLSVDEKQAVLVEVDITKRLEQLANLLAREQEILEVGASIQNQVQEKIGKTQREHYLREQMRQIQKELADSDPLIGEVDDLRTRVEEANMSQEAQEAAQRELSRLEQMMPASPEYSVARTYLDWLLALPWSKSTEDHLDLKASLKILDDDHYGLEKVKERILEYLAVRRLRPEAKGPILCFVGPPGVGKTSLGRSIARAMGRNFTRISLGGVRDEAEIRGHRRTYVGALPGRLIQGLKKAGSNNPVFMLDEIDKVGADFRGDPAAALLEVLDPEQNFSFEDHYLDIPFDLSKVMFITTANLLNTVPPALRDRMEEIPIPGYTQEEKLEIARRHLVPRQLQEHGLLAKKLRFDDEAILRLIGEFTREAGLRNLDRQLGTLCRKSARRFVEGRRHPIRVRPKQLEEFLGVAHFFSEVAERQGEIGVATGLAATAAGGEILFIEATRMKGKKGLILTGQLGDVMKESAQAALSYLKSHAIELGIDTDMLDESDLHLHVPAGATPKEGPSAGVALAVTLLSLLTSRPVRADVAMTGEITLRGRVLPVGGIRDKVLAAQRAGIHTVVLPKRNERDLEEVPDDVREALHFELVATFDEAMAIAFAKPAKKKRAVTRSKKRTAAKKSPAKKSATKKRAVAGGKSGRRRG
ncbi:MAG: endopeptidase La [Gemmatimonadetes bacterium]|nr:endopeptidase La [Gemmatimonadota bacterium]MBT5144510.1 endopeptidase La [Gemmatimonadota bacterium]MBT5587966.1 endopeptidase La [Gemmatimonadota bacterium]MBT5960239.1 endopeptidase La [Gemmatimonadota bacterium]MBT6630135.1 endopeptidase La [Gemmatimonadota bacterium]